MDPNALDPGKSLEIQSAYDNGGLMAVYMLGKADAYLAATLHIQRVMRLTEARTEAMDVLVEEYTETIKVLHSVKSWIAKNLPEVDLDLWDILMSIDTSEVES